MTALDFPLRFDGRGRTAASGVDDHVRDLVEQVLFTSPGERVNRPDFGSGLLQAVFEPNSDTLRTTAQLLTQAALHQWLGDVIEVEAVEVENQDAALEVTVTYVVRRTQQRRVVRLRQGSAVP
jgi:phage baseplate assembly protein W